MPQPKKVWLSRSEPELHFSNKQVPGDGDAVSPENHTSISQGPED